ncbi:MAG: uroporphyrinogen decarboxylase family protein [Anaerolineae bacterium]
MKPFSVPVTPDWQGLVDCILHKGTPKRVHHIELFLDPEVQEAVCQRFDLLEGLNPNDPAYQAQRQIVIQRFLGYDFIRCPVFGLEFQFNYHRTPDTADLARNNGRNYMDEHHGPITNWEEYEAYPWPDASKLSTAALEWFEKNLPEDMGIIASGGFAHFAENLTWLFGYESLCYALYDQRDLVKAISDRLITLYKAALEQALQFKCVKVVWGSDDMGFKSGTLISPDDLREFVLPGHKLMAEMSHAAGRPYILHACGNLTEIMPDLIDDVKIDGKHSFEDNIERVEEVKYTYGQRIALLGGIDVDFICRSDEAAVRARVRRTLDTCQPGGGYCLGTGNSVANYIPLDNYLAMVDEGRRYGR